MSRTCEWKIDQTTVFKHLWTALSKSKSLRILKVVFHNYVVAEQVSLPPLGEYDTQYHHFTDAASQKFSSIPNLHMHEMHDVFRRF